MAFGPVEVLVLVFPGNRFRGEIIPELQRLVGEDVIGIIDGVFVSRDDDGDLTVIEFAEVEGDDVDALAGLGQRVVHLLSDDDITDLAAELEPNSSAAIMVFEHRWATQLQSVVLDAGGELAANFRVPAPVVAEVAAAIPD